MNDPNALAGPATSLTGRSYDVLVVGGTFAGLGAAMNAARNGSRVLLTEQRTVLGTELTATLRPWLPHGELERLSKLLGGLGDCAVPKPREAALIPDRFKIALEDLLLNAGVEFRYGMRPIGWRGEGPYEVSYAAKQGHFRVQADRLLDATSQADLAAWVTPTRPRPVGALWRTIELTGVNLDLLTHSAVAVPPEITSCVRMHLGSAANGHVLLEHAVPHHEQPWQQELCARATSMTLARWLREHHPAFVNARVTETSQDLTRPPKNRLLLTEARVSSAGAPEAAFRHGSGLWIAGPAADIDDEAARQLAGDPARLAELGARLTQEALKDQPDRTVLGDWIMPACHTRTADVLVIGGGTSGVAAAIGAARHGARVVLAEMNMGLGGTGTLGGVDSYWFGRRAGFNLEVSAWTDQQHRWMNWPSGAKWNVEGKMQALLEHATQEGVQVELGAIHLRPRLDTGGRVCGALLVSPEGLLDVKARVTVDATGDGDVAVAAGATATYGSDREGNTMWYSLASHPRPGLTKNNFTSSVDVSDPADYTRAVLSGRRRLTGHDHGPYIAPRESRHVDGAVRLTLTDQLTLRRWPDVVNVHFSNHDVKGHTTSDWVRLGLIPPNLEVEVPYRALIPRHVDGLLVTGKAISASHDALPAIRMQADLENLGFACGIAAALSATRNVTPRHLPVVELQAALVTAGILPAERTLERQEASSAPQESLWQSWIETLDDQHRLYELSFMEFHEVQRAPIPFVQICTAGPAIIPLLMAQLTATSPRRLMSARALAWYGHQAAVPVLLEAISAELGGGRLPARRPMPFTQASPDHGAMPDLAYLLHTLALTRDVRSIKVLHEIVDRLDPDETQLHDQLSGMFHYVDAVCDVAERLGDPGCLPVLQQLADHAFLKGHLTRNPVQPDFFQERLAYLELVINRSLARCGDKHGAQMLIDYLNDARRPLARHAARELALISGLEFGLDRMGWQGWLDGEARLEPRPWLQRSEDPYHQNQP